MLSLRLFLEKQLRNGKDSYLVFVDDVEWDKTFGKSKVGTYVTKHCNHLR